MDRPVNFFTQSNNAICVLIFHSALLCKSQLLSIIHDESANLFLQLSVPPHTSSRVNHNNRNSSLSVMKEEIPKLRENDHFAPTSFVERLAMQYELNTYLYGVKKVRTRKISTKKRTVQKYQVQERRLSVSSPRNPKLSRPQNVKSNQNIPKSRTKKLRTREACSSTASDQQGPEKQTRQTIYAQCRNPMTESVLFHVKQSHPFSSHPHDSISCS